jgi:hypothetical protein
LVERCNGIAEASGSNPLSSIKISKYFSFLFPRLQPGKTLIEAPPPVFITMQSMVMRNFLFRVPFYFVRADISTLMCKSSFSVMSGFVNLFGIIERFCCIFVKMNTEIILFTSNWFGHQC